MNKRPFPAAAGLVILYAGLLQLSMAAPLLVQVFTFDMDAQGLATAISLVLSLGGQTAFGYSVTAQRSVVPAAIVWGIGSVATVVSVVKLGDISGSMMFIIVLQQLGGLVAVVAVARARAAAPPLRRELGALLLLLGVGHVIGAVWMLIYQVHMFGLSALSPGSVLGMSIWPVLSLIVSGFAGRAALALLAGDANAQSKVTVWKWVAIGTSVGSALLTFVSLSLMNRDLPVAMLINPFVSAAVSAIMPLSIGNLVDRASDEPVDPRDAASVPTVFAWAALWLAPLLVAAALVLKTSFIGPILGPTDAHADLVSALCALGAALLVATAISVVHALPFAKLLTHVTAALSVCAAVYVAYSTLQVDARNARALASALPVGSFITFAAAMVALAMFEARREQNLAPARVVD